MNIEIQYKTYLIAPSCTLFSNTTSAQEFKVKLKKTVVSFEKAHNFLHLSEGVWLQIILSIAKNDDKIEAVFIQNSNVDMGENNTSAFDPIFSFYHCNVDYALGMAKEKPIRK